MPNQPKTPLRSVRIDTELWADAKHAAAEDGTSVSDVIRVLLESWLNARENDIT